MLNFCDFIQVYVFTTNHHLKMMNVGRRAGGGAVGRASTIGFRSRAPKPFEILE